MSIEEYGDLRARVERMAKKQRGFWCPGCTKQQQKAAGFGVWQDGDGEVHAAYLVCIHCRREHPNAKQQELIDKIEPRIARLHETNQLTKKKGILHVTKEML